MEETDHGERSIPTSLNSNTKYRLLLKEGDILFSTRSTLAKLGIVRKFLRWPVPISMSEVGLTCGHDCHILGCSWLLLVACTSYQCRAKLTSLMPDTGKASKNLKKHIVENGVRQLHSIVIHTSNIAVEHS
jgi:hypothetical protein